MLRNKYLLLTCLILVHFIRTSYSAKHCKTSFCGNIHNISYPFRLKDDPKGCGDPRYEISCENNTTASIYLDSLEYHVRAINYQNSTIRVADTSIKKNNTCSFPLYSPNWYTLTYSICPYYIRAPWSITFITCPFALNDSNFTETDECVHRNYSRIGHTYIKVGYFNASYLRDMCTISVVAMTSFPFKDENNTSLAEIHDALLYGFELSWGECGSCHLWKRQVSCDKLRVLLGVLPVVLLGVLFGVLLGVLPGVLVGVLLGALLGVLPRSTHIGIIHPLPSLSYLAFSYPIYVIFAMAYFGLRFMIGVPFLLCLIIYKLRRRHLSMFDLIEGFLQSHNNLMPIRYSYSDIKKMTRGFREKLGQGGYGSVYKGKLLSGNIVAMFQQGRILGEPSLIYREIK